MLVRMYARGCHILWGTRYDRVTMNNQYLGYLRGDADGTTRRMIELEGTRWRSGLV